MDYRFLVYLRWGIDFYYNLWYNYTTMTKPLTAEDIDKFISDTLNGECGHLFDTVLLSIGFMFVEGLMNLYKVEGLMNLYKNDNLGVEGNDSWGK